MIETDFDRLLFVRDQTGRAWIVLDGPTTKALGLSVYDGPVPETPVVSPEEDEAVSRYAQSSLFLVFSKYHPTKYFGFRNGEYVKLSEVVPEDELSRATIALTDFVAPFWPEWHADVVRIAQASMRRVQGDC